MNIINYTKRFTTERKRGRSASRPTVVPSLTNGREVKYNAPSPKGYHAIMTEMAIRNKKGTASRKKNISSKRVNTISLSDQELGQMLDAALKLN